MLELSYIVFQSDGIAKSIESNRYYLQEIKPHIKDKYIILLLDNDESCYQTIKPLQIAFKDIVKVVLPIKMIDLLTTEVFFNDKEHRASQESRSIWKENKQVPENYDFKDVVHMILEPKRVVDVLHLTISNLLKERL